MLMKSNVKTFPGTLILQRKSISQFPNGPKVALYYSEKIKKYFTVTLEDYQQLYSEEFINTLEGIDEDIIQISFNDDTTLNINKECSTAMLGYLDELNSEEKQIVETYIQESSENFLEVLNISISRETNQPIEGN